MFSETESRKPIQYTVQVLCLAGLIAIFLTACTLQNVPTPTASATEIHIEILPLATDTPISTTTPKPTSTATLTPTVDAITALASEFNVPPVCMFKYQVSNDRNWIAVDCPIQREMNIANKASEEKIVIKYEEMEGAVSTNFSTRPLSWSGDDRYFYFTTRCCDYNDSYNSNGSLYRLDTQTEKWDILVHAIFEPYYYFSDKGERYVFINQSPPDELEIGMVDTLANRSKRVNLKYYFVPLDYGETKHMWSKSDDQFAIVLEKITAIHIGGIDAVADTTDVVLRIDFTQMVMELVENFDENNLLGKQVQ